MYQFLRQSITLRSAALAPALLCIGLSVQLCALPAAATPREAASCPVSDATVSAALRTEVRGLGLFPGTCMYATGSDDSQDAIAVTIRVRTSADFKNGAATRPEKTVGGLYNALGKHLSASEQAQFDQSINIKSAADLLSHVCNDPLPQSTEMAMVNTTRYPIGGVGEKACIAGDGISALKDGTVVQVAIMHPRDPKHAPEVHVLQVLANAAFSGR